MGPLATSGGYWDTQHVPWYTRWFSSPECKWCFEPMEKIDGTFNETWVCRDCDWFVVHKPEERKQRVGF